MSVVMGSRWQAALALRIGTGSTGSLLWFSSRLTTAVRRHGSILHDPGRWPLLHVVLEGLLQEDTDVHCEAAVKAARHEPAHLIVDYVYAVRDQRLG